MGGARAEEKLPLSFHGSCLSDEPDPDTSYADGKVGPTAGRTREAEARPENEAKAETGVASRDKRRMSIIRLALPGLASAAPPPPPLADTLPHGWEELAADNGARYYHHQATGETTWHRPTT